MSNVINLHHRGTPDHALESAKGQFQDVLIIGYDPDGDLRVYSSDKLCGLAEVNFLVDQFKHALLTDYFITEVKD